TESGFDGLVMTPNVSLQVVVARIEHRLFASGSSMMRSQTRAGRIRNSSCSNRDCRNRGCRNSHCSNRRCQPHLRIGSMAEDEFLEALTALQHTLADNQKRATLIKKRIAQLRRLRSRGASYAEVVAVRDGPLIVQLLTESSKALD